MKSSRLERVAEAQLPTAHGPFQAVCFRDRETGAEELALVFRGDDDARRGPTLVRLHSECLTGDVLGSLRCDCGPQAQAALAAIAAAGAGVFLYLRQEGRGIGLANKIRAYALQDEGADTVDANVRLGFLADGRDFAVAAEMLRDLGVTRVRLLTNNPAKIGGLERGGVTVVERVPLEMRAHRENAGYLSTKRRRLGHLLSV
jgi:3,4-dihydroxy 2-butanone 4-phosphate synthase / GTP cyclohydrolase II